MIGNITAMLPPRVTRAAAGFLTVPLAEEIVRLCSVDDATGF
jgi:hypothetical protein